MCPPECSHLHAKGVWPTHAIRRGPEVKSSPSYLSPTAVSFQSPKGGGVVVGCWWLVTIISHLSLPPSFPSSLPQTHEPVAIKQISLKSVPGRLSNIRQKEIAILKVTVCVYGVCTLPRGISVQFGRPDQAGVLPGVSQYSLKATSYL